MNKHAVTIKQIEENVQHDLLAQKSKFLNSIRRYNSGLNTLVPRVLGESVLVTPNRYVSKILVSDKEIWDDQERMNDLSKVLADGFGYRLDTEIAKTFSQFIGTGVGIEGKPLRWATISDAWASLSAKGGQTGKVFCVLHPYQWYSLGTTLTTAGGLIEKFNDPLKTDFTPTIYKNLAFVISPAVEIDQHGNALGAIYAQDSIGMDVQQDFAIDAERNLKAGETILNASMVYGVGVVRPNYGVKIISSANLP